MAGDQARLRMLRRGLRGNAWAKVSEWEIRRKKISYTVDTVKTWVRRYPRAVFFWIMGSDQWEALSSWKEPQELRKMLRFLVFPRPENPRPRQGFWMREIPVRIDISATEVRTRLLQKLSIQGLVLPAVEQSIRHQRWYR